MPIKNLSEKAILVDLPKEPQLGAELRHLNEVVGGKKAGCDVIIDFSCVEIIVSTSISNLIILRNLLAEHGHRIFLCRVGVLTKCIFRVAGLETFFEFVEDSSEALSALQASNN